ncbi:conserved protein of unknown function [Cupriavidus neocaledonicus]|uniref:Uncharacterized protein n=2 Tax=Cupriavidus neocaledonicus TaxID=1040979 RepID=A0A375H8Y1_9BURK|nr:conserved protein of unknown function [Cupriavidus neocaledonicus]
MAFAGNKGHHDEWYLFPSISSLPPCMVYDFRSDIKFELPPGCGDFEVVEIELSNALSALPVDDQLYLNPGRWSDVKKDLSEGWCYTPEMTLCEDGKPKLMNGRHRTVAMIRLLGLDYAQFAVPKEMVGAVRAHLKTR